MGQFDVIKNSNYNTFKYIKYVQYEFIIIQKNPSHHWRMLTNQFNVFEMLLIKREASVPLLPHELKPRGIGERRRMFIFVDGIRGQQPKRLN